MGDTVAAPDAYIRYLLFFRGSRPLPFLAGEPVEGGYERRGRCGWLHGSPQQHFLVRHSFAVKFRVTPLSNRGLAVLVPVNGCNRNQHKVLKIFGLPSRRHCQVERQPSAAILDECRTTSIAVTGSRERSSRNAFGSTSVSV